MLNGGRAGCENGFRSKYWCACVWAIPQIRGRIGQMSNSWLKKETNIYKPVHLNHTMRFSCVVHLSWWRRVPSQPHAHKDFTTHHALHRCVCHVIPLMLEAAGSDGKRILPIEWCWCCYFQDKWVLCLTRTHCVNFMYTPFKRLTVLRLTLSI